MMAEALTEIGMKPSHPGEFIRTEVPEPLGLDAARAARILDVRPATLSDLVNGKAGLPPQMALRIGKAFGVNGNTLLRVQAWWDSRPKCAKAAAVTVHRYSPSRT